MARGEAVTDGKGARLKRQPRAHVRPVKWHAWDGDLNAFRLRVVGYRLACDCGVIGTLRKSYDVARADVAEHECQVTP